MKHPEFLQLMMQIGLTQRDMSVIAGVTTKTIRNWEHGNHHVPMSVALILRAIAENKVSIEWILNRVNLGG